MKPDQEKRYSQICMDIKRVSKEMQTRTVRSDKALMYERVDEAVKLYEEKDKLKALDWGTKKGLNFLRKQRDALEKSKNNGWSRRTYKHHAGNVTKDAQEVMKEGVTDDSKD